METQCCRRCTEDNPPEALLCWACYTPLKGAKIAPLRLNDGTELHFPFDKFKKWREKAENAAPLLLIGLLTSSGWWRGKTRFGVLGAGVAIVALIFAVQEVGEGKRRPPKSASEAETNPIVRIADTILLHGIKDKATAIRILIVGRGVKVEYQIEGEWHERISIPLDMWAPLQNEMCRRASSGVWFSELILSNPMDSTSAPEIQGDRFVLQISVEVSREEILLSRI